MVLLLNDKKWITVLKLADDKILGDIVTLEIDKDIIHKEQGVFE